MGDIVDLSEQVETLDSVPHCSPETANNDNETDDDVEDEELPFYLQAVPHGDDGVCVVLAGPSVLRVYYDPAGATASEPDETKKKRQDKEKLHGGVRGVDLHSLFPVPLTSCCMLHGGDLAVGDREGALRILTGALTAVVDYCRGSHYRRPKKKHASNHNHSSSKHHHPTHHLLVRKLHWHAHAIASMTTSSTGNGDLLYTGGDESVLVTWQLARGGLHKPAHVLPRLALGGIRHLRYCAVVRTTNAECPQRQPGRRVGGFCRPPRASCHVTSTLSVAARVQQYPLPWLLVVHACNGVAVPVHLRDRRMVGGMMVLLLLWLLVTACFFLGRRFHGGPPWLRRQDAQRALAVTDGEIAAMEHHERNGKEAVKIDGAHAAVPAFLCLFGSSLSRLVRMQLHQQDRSRRTVRRAPRGPRRRHHRREERPAG